MGGTIAAYFGMYITSDLESIRGSASERDPVEVATFYAAWGLMWIHSAYANYCLSGEEYGEPSIVWGNSDVNPVSDLAELAKRVYTDKYDRKGEWIAGGVNSRIIN